MDDEQTEQPEEVAAASTPADHPADPDPTLPSSPSADVPAATSPMSAPTWPLPPADPAGSPAPTVPTPVPAFQPPFTAPPPPPPAPPVQPSTFAPLPPPADPPKARRSRLWVAVVLVSALIGGAVGAGVVAIFEHNNDNVSNVTIHESNATPGAAVLSGNVTIPELVKKVIKSVVSIDVKSEGDEDQGTGMIITSDGEVITNNHVIELYADNGNQGTITVTEYGQTKALPTTLVGYDTAKDVALLKIDNASGLPTVTFGSSTKTQVGDAVVAIGNALGLAAGTPTVTQGIISALGRSVTASGEGTQSETLTDLMQTDAAINPGNSGGPLIDTAGQVIGMNTAVAGTADDGTSAQNIGFAIPIDQVETLIPVLEKGGQVTPGGGYLGVDITTLTPALRQQYGFTPTSGVVILDVLSGSPADKAGLQQGDIIVAIDGTTVTSGTQLQSAIQKDKPGQSISVSYYVGDNKHTTSVTLGTQAEAQQQESQQSQSTTGGLGGGGFPGLGGG